MLPVSLLGLQREDEDTRKRDSPKESQHVLLTGGNATVVDSKVLSVVQPNLTVIPYMLLAANVEM